MTFRPSTFLATGALGAIVLTLLVTSIPAQAEVDEAGKQPASTPTTSPKVKVPNVTWDDCRSYVPKRARCGHIRVAADPLRPELGKQTVGFELYPHRDKSKPSLEPLVAQEGGPGYPSTGTRDYYLDLFQPMANRHDLLLVDERGTGTSGALLCKALQQGTMPYVKAVTACGKQLGERADTYGTAYGADDMARVLDALGIDKIDLYGDSYGTFFAQTFALRHPDRLRTLVLDASYPLSGNDPWWRDTNRAIQNALQRVCDRDPTCAGRSGSPVARLRSVASQVHHHPVHATAYNADGRLRHVTLNGVNLALTTAYATYGTSNYRELDAAVRAFNHGYQAPLLRMIAENIVKSWDNGPVIDYSSAEYIGVVCNDYPQLWDVSLPPGHKRVKQYRAAVADVKHNDPNGFDPFRADDWIHTLWTEPKTCIGWPAPTDPVPPEVPGTPYPNVPTLVLSGDLDSVTSPEGGMNVASRFPNATFVPVPNLGHVSALGDRLGCASGIVLHFVRSGGTGGDTSCTSDYVPVRVVPRFARSSTGLTPAQQGANVSSSRADRQVIAGALYATADPMTRWFNNYSGHGVGLRGGTFSYHGSDTVTYDLNRLAFVRDVAVTGTLKWDRNHGMMRATVTVDGPGARDGHLKVSWRDWDKHAMATVVGKLGGRNVDLLTPAP